VISVPTGASAVKPEWVDFFDSCTGLFYIAYDNDDAGNIGAVKLMEKIGITRCKRVILPLKDINECLMAGYTDIDKWLNTAQDQSLDNLVKMVDMFSRMDELFKLKDKGCGKEIEGMGDLNYRLGGLREAEITVLTGDTGSGKSTFTLNVFYNLIVQNEPILIASTEMQTEQVIAALWTMHIGKKFHDFSEADYSRCVNWFGQKPIYFVDIYGRLTLKQIDDYITYCKRKYNVMFVLLDHLHFFIERLSDNERRDIDNFIFEMVGISRKTKTNIWLVAHPSKLDNKKGIVHMNDLKGSSAIKQDANNVITVWRDRDLEESKDPKNEVVINCEKVRHISGVGGKKRYEFNKEGLTYNEKTYEDNRADETRDNGYYN